MYIYTGRVAEVAAPSSDAGARQKVSREEDSTTNEQESRESAIEAKKFTSQENTSSHHS